MTRQICLQAFPFSGCDPAGLVQCPNSWIAPKSIGEGASSLFGGWPGSLENVSSSSATPDFHRCNLGVAPVQEAFSRLSGSPKKDYLLLPLSIEGESRKLDIVPGNQDLNFRAISCGEKKTNKEKSHKGIWRSDAPEASQGQTRDVPGTHGTFGLIYV